MTPLSPKQVEPCHQDRWDLSDRRAIFINSTLKRSPERSHTQGPADISMEILLHVARMLEDGGGVPAHGDQRAEWDAGCRFDFPNPEHR